MSDQAEVQTAVVPVATDPGQTTALAETRPKRARVTRKNFVKKTEKALMERLPELLPVFFDAVSAKAKKGDTETLKMVARILGYDRGAQGISITNNLFNANVQQEAQGRKSFESLVSELDARDRARQERQQTIDVTPQR